MTGAKDHVAAIFTAIGERLTASGFVRRKNYIFTLSLSREAAGWLGLNKALSAEGIVRINPVVGVHHRELESLVSQLLELPAGKYLPPSISVNVGYLMPDERYTAWSFTPGEPVESGADAIVAAVEKHGRPYMQRHSDLLSLRNAMLESKRGTPPDQLDYRIISALLLEGENHRAFDIMENEIKEIEDRNDAAAQFFRRFAANVRKRFSTKRG